MNVQIKLDKPNEVYTNLDVITGKVVLQLRNPTNIQSVTVKLEGESRSRLLTPPRDDRRDKPRPELEIHKVHSHSYLGNISHTGPIPLGAGTADEDR